MKYMTLCDFADLSYGVAAETVPPEQTFWKSVSNSLSALGLAVGALESDWPWEHAAKDARQMTAPASRIGVLMAPRLLSNQRSR
jgi:hypothetical protein